jgi:predicted transcriptional regulator
LNILREQPELTIKEVAEQIGITQRGVEKSVANLRTEGKIRYVGPKKGGHWELLVVKGT